MTTLKENLRILTKRGDINYWGARDILKGVHRERTENENCPLAEEMESKVYKAVNSRAGAYDELIETLDIIRTRNKHFG